MVKSVQVRRDLLGRGAVALTERSEQAIEIVSVGVPVDRTELRLVGEDGMPLVDHERVGEIQIRGASVMRYYEGEDDSDETVASSEGWVSTGDLGFRLDGELFIAGRKKEMIIVYGQNYFSSDIEAIAGVAAGDSSQAALAAGLSFPDGEGLVIFLETKAVDPEIRANIVTQVRCAVSSGLGVAPRDIVLVRRGRLPRTSSGKLERRSVEALYHECTSVDSRDPVSVRANRRSA
jgi:acyl-CoA synthetase (AMP-forming)/AMP-acid ligase II